MKPTHNNKYIGFLATAIMAVTCVMPFSVQAASLTAATVITPVKPAVKDVAPTATATTASADTSSTPALQETDVSRFTNAIALINEFYVIPILNTWMKMLTKPCW
jgi:hypothetical protein